jgi:hypothetical protein
MAANFSWDAEPDRLVGQIMNLEQKEDEQYGGLSNTITLGLVDGTLFTIMMRNSAKTNSNWMKFITTFRNQYAAAKSPLDLVGKWVSIMTITEERNFKDEGKKETRLRLIERVFANRAEAEKFAGGTDETPKASSTNGHTTGNNGVDFAMIWKSVQGNKDLFMQVIKGSAPASVPAAEAFLATQQQPA